MASSLAKSAIFGHDPNWGRIAAAAGYSGVVFDQDNLMVKLGDTLLMDNGQPLEFDAKLASKYLADTCGEHGTVYITVIQQQLHKLLLNQSSAVAQYICVGLNNSTT